jgi:NADH-quinone oxidoreductase subunit M
MLPILTILIAVPLLGALIVALLRGPEEGVAARSRFVALYTSGFTFIASLYLLLHFDKGNPGFQFVEKHAWFPEFGLNYALGIDGISLFFVLLSTLLTPICILASWTSIEKRVREYMLAFLILEALMIGTFAALDMFLFYVFFEAVLIPMFIIIGVWGGPRRVYSAFKFFLYTFLGSVLMLVAMVFMFGEAGTADIPTLMTHAFAYDWQIWLFLAFFASFAVKMPMWPVHTWLPDAHVEAPTAGSVILAGVLLKMGGYGFLRFSLPMFPEATLHFTPLIMTLSVIAIIYTSLVALVQEDMKKLIAYSSVAHMGFVTLGIFALNIEGLQGSVFQMISHGLISAALFLSVGVVYDRLHTREISRYGGLVNNMPRYATLFMLLMLGSVGLPGTSGFVGEFLSMLGAFKASTVYATLAATGVVFGAAYMLLLYRRVIFGPQVNADAAAMKDVTTREYVTLVPLVIMMLAIGISPNFVLSRTEPALANTLAIYQAKIDVTKQVVANEAESTDAAADTTAEGDADAADTGAKEQEKGETP